MADTTFVDNSTVIVSAWLNDINDHVYNNTPVSPATTVHSASVISNTPTGGIAATTVQAAINELDTDKLAVAAIGTSVPSPTGTGASGTWGISITGNAATATSSTTSADAQAHIADTVAAHAASAISNTPAGGIAATDVQAAINELDTEKAALSGATFTGATVHTTVQTSGVIGVGAAPSAAYGIQVATGTATYGAYIQDNVGVGTAPTAGVKFRARGADSGSSNYSLYVDNSAAAAILTVRNDGRLDTGTAASSPYNSTTATAANMVVTSAGLIQRSTSSLRFKTGVEDMEQQYAEALVYQSRPVYYRSTCEADNPLHSYWGFIAEELALIDPRVVQWGKPMHTVVKDVERERFVRDVDGNKMLDAEGQPLKETYIEQVEVTETNEAAALIPDGVAYERFVVALVKVAQEQKSRIEALEARLVAAGI